MSNLFAYGTLMCEDIMAEVSRFRLPFMSGKLREFIRRRIMGEYYPAIVPEAKGEVAGIVYLDVPPPAWRRLDLFEGEMYVRRSVLIECGMNAAFPAETFVLKPEFQNVLEALDWDYDAFLLHDKALFRKHYKGYFFAR